MIARKIVRQTREDLGLSGQTAKGAGMENTGAVAGKRRAIWMGRLRMYTGREGTVAVDGNVSRKRIIQFSW